MKKTIAKLINRIDRFLHVNFDFLNLNKPGKFNKNYEWIYKYIESEKVDLSKKTLFLKIDTQGYEFQVLKGAEKILKKFEGILVEVSLIELYEGQKNWLEIVEFIQSHGFKLWSVDRGFSNKKNGQTLQLDLCFFK